MMKIKNLIVAINNQVEDLTSIIKTDISNLEQVGDDKEKYKAQKCLTDTLHKITNIILHLKKLEKIADEIGEDNIEKDMKILSEFISRNSKKERNG